MSHALDVPVPHHLLVLGLPGHLGLLGVQELDVRHPVASSQPPLPLWSRHQDHPKHPVFRKERPDVLLLCGVGQTPQLQHGSLRRARQHARLPRDVVYMFYTGPLEPLQVSGVWGGGLARARTHGRGGLVLRLRGPLGLRKGAARGGRGVCLLERSWERPRGLQELLLGGLEDLNVPLSQHLLLEGEGILKLHGARELDEGLARGPSVRRESEHGVPHREALEESSDVPVLCRERQAPYPDHDGAAARLARRRLGVAPRAARRGGCPILWEIRAAVGRGGGERVRAAREVMVLPVPVGGPLLLSVVVLGKGRAVVPVGPHSRGSLRLRGGLELLLLVILDLGLGPRGLGVRHAAVEGRGRGRDGAGRLGRDSRAASVSVSRSPAAAPRERASLLGARSPAANRGPTPGLAVQKQLDVPVPHALPVLPLQRGARLLLRVEERVALPRGLPVFSHHHRLGDLEALKEGLHVLLVGLVRQASHTQAVARAGARAARASAHDHRSGFETWDRKIR
mmetsp:Transcript_5350/g.19274  ORF Transcript_5350/g.19274 Transcript_5350/m.19274 type:complete len:511 (+) Transcript_5350:945-2477(+)